MSLLAHHHAFLRAATGHRPDTLAHLAAYAPLGYIGFDLDLLDQVHAALEAAGLAAGYQASRHFSAAPFGVLAPQNEVEKVACLFGNPLEAAYSQNPVLLQPGGWRGRDGLYYDQAGLKLNALADDVTGEVTVAALGNFGAAPSSGDAGIVVELSGNYGATNSWVLALESELYLGSRLGGFNIASEGAAYAPGPKLAIGRISTALPTTEQVQLRRNGQNTTGRLYNFLNTQTGSYRPDATYVGAREGTSNYLHQANLQAVFVATRRLSDSQLAIFQPLRRYYNL